MVDEFMHNNPDALVVFAAGNSGTQGDYSVRLRLFFKMYIFICTPALCASVVACCLLFSFVIYDIYIYTYLYARLPTTHDPPQTTALHTHQNQPNQTNQPN